MSSGEEITEFAESLRGLKDRSGRSYGMLAERLHVSTSTLHRYCNGDAVPAEYAVVERFARLCEATPEELIALHRRWILADTARRSASGRGRTGRATAPDGASGRPAARRGSAARAVGAPDAAGRTAGPPDPATQAAGAGPAGSGTARAGGTASAIGRGSESGADDATGLGGLSAADAAVSDHQGPRAGRDSAVDASSANSAATREGEAYATTADPSRARTSEAGDTAEGPIVEGDAPEGRTKAAFAAEGAADVDRDEPGKTPHPASPGADTTNEDTPQSPTTTTLTAKDAADVDRHEPGKTPHPASPGADTTNEDTLQSPTTTTLTAKDAAAGESAGGARAGGGRGGAARAGAAGPGAGARGGDGPSVERQSAHAGGARRAAEGEAPRTDREGGRAPDGPGGRAAGSAGRARGAAGRGPLRPVPAVGGAGRRPVGLRAWRSRPWGLMLGAAAAAVLALTAVEVRSTTGGEREEAATSPSSPVPSTTVPDTAPPARPTARGGLKKDDTADGRESASPRGGGRRGGASASPSPKQGGAGDGDSGGGRDDKPGSGIPLTVSTRSHIWENGCGHRYLINRPPSQVAPPPVEQDAAAWASAHGAVHGGTTNVETTVKGRSESAVVLQALHVRVVGRRAPLPWSSFAMDNGCGGSLTPRAFSVNLDAARPLAVPTDGNDAGEPIPAVRFPYRVSDTDPEVLLVNARTSGCDCSWYLELDWTSGDREGTIRIDDHGAPFRTSGVKGRPEYGYQFAEQVWHRND
ncbi:helix-turn-helix domain-containing protein [Streptomyces sp. LZ34]